MFRQAASSASVQSRARDVETSACPLLCRFWQLQNCLLHATDAMAHWQHMNLSATLGSCTPHNWTLRRQKIRPVHSCPHALSACATSSGTGPARPPCSQFVLRPLTCRREGHNHRAPTSLLVASSTTPGGTRCCRSSVPHSVHKRCAAARRAASLYIPAHLFSAQRSCGSSHA